MKLYLVTIGWNQPYPKTETVRIEAHHVATAAARALREWKSKIGRKRYDGLSVKITVAN